MSKEFVKTGTTTVGIVCKDAVVLASDRRATAGTMVVDRKAKKIHPIADKMMITTAGVVSDIQLLTKLIKAEVKLKDIQTGRATTVMETANLLAGLEYNNIRQPSMVIGIAAFLLGGHDKHGFHLYNIGPDGSISEKDEYDSDGSGSPFALGVLETGYKPGMDSDAGVKLAKKAVNTALKMDSATGNGIEVYIINSEGIKKVVDEKINPGLDD